MSFSSFLSAIGKDAKSVFSWISSTKGQAIITAGEGVLTGIDPALSGILTLANSWLQKIITTETLAAAAGKQVGSGTQKAAAVLSALQPQIAQYFPNATATELQNANTALVAFLNAFSVTSSTPTNGTGA